MKVVKDVLIEKLINYLNDLVFLGKVKLNGQYKDYDIFKTIKDGNVLRKYLYLESETGYVEEAQLLTSMGEVLAVKPYNIEKRDDGLILAFEFTLTVTIKET